MKQRQFYLRAAAVREDPIELLDTTTDEEPNVLTTDSERIMPLAWYLEHGFDATPKTVKLASASQASAAAGPSIEAMPRASQRKRGSLCACKFTCHSMQ